MKRDSLGIRTHHEKAGICVLCGRKAPRGKPFESELSFSVSASVPFVAGELCRQCERFLVPTCRKEEVYRRIMSRCLRRPDLQELLARHVFGGAVERAVSGRSTDEIEIKGALARKLGRSSGWIARLAPLVSFAGMGIRGGR
jgi:hypothetical protein